MAKPIIAVVGLGTMGLGIAQVYAQAGHRVLATDALPGARATAAERVSAMLASRVTAGRMTADEAQAIAGRLEIVGDVADLAPASLVIEAIAEDADAKRALFTRLEQAAPLAVLATNTSSLRVGDLAAGLADPTRLIGLHFFNPAQAMKLVELIAPPGTEQAAALARSLTEAAGKTVVSAPDSPGFIVNRCARPFYGEALILLEEGHDPAGIDAAMVAAGYRMGPFALIDLIGADINLAATQSLWRAMGGHPRYHVPERLVAQVAAGRLGRKSGAGFIGTGATDPPADSRAIADRIEATLVNEALWLAASGGVRPDAIDTALKLGLNFPRGPFEILRQRGEAAVRHDLATLEGRAPPQLKTRYLPPVPA
ncbi:3-hydroxybutyryl-CoA dehydrogenase [Aliigemmobacter aestuarii]|uniref:3-hydroxybutyryl-CoA dehydrogenase n=1 Tax=Aliigemmobacter aestuarii TaxID=1445661 RepID=A0A4S3MN97_9RHOB|nr:3-hydroxyacyl-CoA dehydrogenase NAD-binding domain-containing protein [Gemmobacter aestuarii]THD83767.1 3-hydroxybutyryl-CoA dehydrogenase [Gemmobacter aestuarii]